MSTASSASSSPCAARCAAVCSRRSVAARSETRAETMRTAVIMRQTGRGMSTRCSCVAERRSTNLLSGRSAGGWTRRFSRTSSLLKKSMAAGLGEQNTSHLLRPQQTGGDRGSSIRHLPAFLLAPLADRARPVRLLPAAMHASLRAAPGPMCGGREAELIVAMRPSCTSRITAAAPRGQPHSTRRSMRTPFTDCTAHLRSTCGCRPAAQHTAATASCRHAGTSHHGLVHGDAHARSLRSCLFF
jgi:hypothetical protein